MKYIESIIDDDKLIKKENDIFRQNANKAIFESYKFH
jgi:hypothetical protein